MLLVILWTQPETASVNEHLCSTAQPFASRLGAVAAGSQMQLLDAADPLFVHNDAALAPAATVEVPVATVVKGTASPREAHSAIREVPSRVVATLQF